VVRMVEFISGVMIGTLETRIRLRMLKTIRFLSAVTRTLKAHMACWICAGMPPSGLRIISTLCTMTIFRGPIRLGHLKSWIMV